MMVMGVDVAFLRNHSLHQRMGAVSQRQGQYVAVSDSRAFVVWNWIYLYYLDRVLQGIRLNSPAAVPIVTFLCKLIDVIPGCRRVCPLSAIIPAYQSKKSNVHQIITVEMPFSVLRWTVEGWRVALTALANRRVPSRRVQSVSYMLFQSFKMDLMFVE